MGKRQPSIATSKTRCCCRCKKRLPRECFAPNRFKRSGVQAYCRECGRTAAREQIKRYREENPDYIQRHKLKKYGITVEQFEAMKVAQGGACAICGDRPTSALHVDHCHSTGRVRGLLCRSCNHGLGNFRDSPEAMRRAVEYILEPNGHPSVDRERNIAA